jgi:hypothetical protein
VIIISAVSEVTAFADEHRQLALDDVERLIGVVMHVQWRGSTPGIAIKPLGPDAPIRRIVAVRLPTRYLSASVERFLELLRDAGRRRAAAPI